MAIRATSALPGNRPLAAWRIEDDRDVDEEVSGERFVESWNACPYSDEANYPKTDRVPHTPWPTAYALGMHAVICMKLGFHGDDFKRFIDTPNIPAGQLRGDECPKCGTRELCGCVI